MQDLALISAQATSLPLLPVLPSRGRLLVAGRQPRDLRPPGACPAARLILSGPQRVRVPPPRPRLSHRVRISPPAKLQRAERLQLCWKPCWASNSTLAYSRGPGFPTTQGQAGCGLLSRRERPLPATSAPRASVSNLGHPSGPWSTVSLREGLPEAPTLEQEGLRQHPCWAGVQAAWAWTLGTWGRPQHRATTPRGASLPKTTPGLLLPTQILPLGLHMMGLISQTLCRTKELLQ